MEATRLIELIQGMTFKSGSDLDIAMIDPRDRRNSYFGVFNAATDGKLIFLSPFADSEQSEQPAMRAFELIDTLEQMSKGFDTAPEVVMVDAYAKELSLVEIKSAAFDAGMILLSPFDFKVCEATEEAIDDNVQ